MGRHELDTGRIVDDGDGSPCQRWEPRRASGRHRQQSPRGGHAAWATVTTSAFLAIGSQLVAPMTAAAHPVDAPPEAQTLTPAPASTGSWWAAIPEVGAAIDQFASDPLATVTGRPSGVSNPPLAQAPTSPGAVPDARAFTEPGVPASVPDLVAGASVGDLPWIEQAAPAPSAVSPVEGTVTSSFGPRWGEVHAGVDIANEIGTPVYAAASGTVIESGPASGFGLWIQLQHADGSTSTYGHIDETFVEVGQQVSAGDQIATVGNRGQSTGPHLHFETTNPDGAKTDPFRWLAARGVAESPLSRV